MMSKKKYKTSIGMRIKSLILAGVISLSSISLTGCGSALQNFAETTFEAAIVNRGEANKTLAKKYYESGIISAGTYESICSNVDKQVKKYTSGLVNTVETTTTNTNNVNNTNTTTTTTDSSSGTSSLDQLVGEGDEDTLYGEGTLDEVVTENTNNGTTGGSSGGGASLDTVTSSSSTSTTTTTDSTTTNTVTTETSNVATEKVDNIARAVKYYKVLSGDLPTYVTYIDDDGVSEDVYKGDAAGAGLDNVWRVPVSSSKPENVSNKGELTGSHFIISNYLQATKFKNINDGTACKTNEWLENTNCEPIDLIGDISEDINAKLRAQVYVLRSDIATVDDCSTTDGISAIIQSAIKNNGEVDASKLNNYFVRALDSNGNPVKLVADDDHSYDIFADSKDNIDKNVNAVGQDLVIEQYKESVLSLKFHEFNYGTYEKLQDLIGLNQGKYLFYQSDSGWIAYLMEYPVSVVDNMTDNNDETVTVDFVKSGLGINFQTGKFIKYDSDGNGGWKASGNAVTTDSPYFTTSSSDSNSSLGLSSLVLKGYTTTEVSNTQGNKVEVYTGRVVLRDYLEATWAPGSTEYDDEDIVVFGRKLRIDTQGSYWKETGETVTDALSGGTLKQYKLVYPKADSIACYININGEEVESQAKLKITDFCEIGAKDGTTLDDAANDRWNNTIIKSIVPSSQTKTTLEKTVNALESKPNISNISSTTEVDSINCTYMFPSADIGNVDYKQDTDKKQRFYCLLVKEGLFDNSLYNDWLNSKSETASLNWWNKYLGQETYIYKIGLSELSDYIRGNYKYEVTQEGNIILDLEAIADIQEIFDNEHSVEQVQFIRTIFVVLGIFLIAYSMILMLAWVLDTSVDIGVSLLNKLTFGHWIAIKYAEDIPSYHDPDSKYIDGKHMFISCLIIIAVAIIAIRVDENYIALQMIKFFGGIGSKIEEIIRGIG